jgi:hypothetical protein
MEAGREVDAEIDLWENIQVGAGDPLDDEETTVAMKQKGWISATALGMVRVRDA